MASPSTAKHSVDETTSPTSKSYFQKTVCLKDWWLVKAENNFDGKQLAIAGITSGEKQAVRVFYSAPIFKRYDIFNLETVDGICVIIEGFMNKAQTLENGFPSEVCNHFVFGFPPYWEIYARNCSEGESTLQSNPESKKLSPQAGRTGDFSIGMTKNFEKACSSTETREYKSKKKLGVKSSLRGGKKETKCNSKDKEAKTASKSNVGPCVSERETFSPVENRKSLQLSENHFDKIVAQPLTPMGLEETSVPSSTKTNSNNTETENHGGRRCRLKNSEDHHKWSPLSSCRRSKVRSCNTTMQSLKDLSKVNSSKKLAEKVVFSSETELSEELCRHSEGREITCSEKKVKEKVEDNKMFGGQLKDDKIMSISLRGSNSVGNDRAKLDKGSREKSTLNPSRTEFQELTNEMSSRSTDPKSSEDYAELDHVISLTGKDAKEDQNQEGIQETVIMQNKTDNAHGKTETRKKKTAGSKRTNSQSESPLSRKFRRKLGFNAVGNDIVNLDDGSKGKSTPTPPETEFQEFTHEMASRTPDARSLEDNVELDHDRSLSGKDGKQDQNEEGVQENVRMQIESNGYMFSYGDTEKRKKKVASRKRNYSQSEIISSRKSRSKQTKTHGESPPSSKSRRKLDSPVSPQGKEKSSIVSPEASSLKQSRYGRRLTPPLEYWRNQLVIYNADREITGYKNLH